MKLYEYIIYVWMWIMVDPSFNSLHGLWKNVVIFATVLYIGILVWVSVKEY